MPFISARRIAQLALPAMLLTPLFAEAAQAEPYVSPEGLHETLHHQYDLQMKLYDSVVAGNLEGVKEAVAQGADLEYEYEKVYDERGYVDDYKKVLEVAVDHGHMHLVRHFAEELGVDYYFQGLAAAAGKGDLDMTHYFVKRQLEEGRGWWPIGFYEAMRKDQMEIVLYYLSLNQHGVFANFQGSMNFSDFQDELNDAAREASALGKLEMLKVLHHAGADLNSEDSYTYMDDPENYNAAISAAWTGQLETLKYAVANGADVRAHDGIALNKASLYGHQNVIRYLVEELGMDVQADNEAALRNAIWGRELESVITLGELGADFNAVDDTWGETYFEKALRLEQPEVARYMADNGADVFAGRGKAIVSAAEHGYEELLADLLSRETEEQKWSGDSLGEALRETSYNRQNGAMELLLWHAFHEDSISQRDKDWAAIWAAEGGNLYGLQLLDSYGANLNYDAERGLRGAAKNGHLDVVKYLMEKRQANAKAYDTSCLCGHEDALAAATGAGQMHVVRYMVMEQNVDVNVERNGKRYSHALIDAAYGDQADMVEFLLDHGADRASVNDNLIHNMSLSEQWDIVELFLSRGFRAEAEAAYESLSGRKYSRSAAERLKAMMDEYAPAGAPAMAPAP